MTTPTNGHTTGHSTAEEKTINENFSFSERSIDFDVYVKSKIGSQHDSNHDNFYINGIFMKTFNFTDIKKSLKTSGDCAAYAVATGTSSDRATKLFLRFFDEMRHDIAQSKSVSTAKKKLKEALIYCNNKLLDESETDNEVYEVASAIAVYIKDTIIYATCGNCTIIKINDKKVTNLTTSCSTLGLKREIAIKCATSTFNETDSVILLSKGIASADSPENIGYQITDKSDTKIIVNNILERVRLVTGNDLTCMSIKAEPYKGIHAKTLIFAGVCFILSVLNLIYTFVIKGA